MSYVVYVNEIVNGVDEDGVDYGRHRVDEDGKCHIYNINIVQNCYSFIFYFPLLMVKSCYFCYFY